MGALEIVVQNLVQSQQQIAQQLAGLNTIIKDRDPNLCIQGNSGAWEKARIVSAQPARLFQLWGVNRKSDTDYYILIFDQPVLAVANQSNFLFPIFAGRSDNFFIDFNQRGFKFSRGIYAAVSSDETKLVAPATNVGWFSWQIQNEVPA